MDHFFHRFRDKYKTRDVAGDVGRLQSERRKKMLLDQRRQRDDAVDQNRGGDLVNYIESFSLPHYKKNLPYKVDVFYRNKLQLSEWLREKPDDLENWFLVPCPKGKRNLIVASPNKTIAYTKSGKIADIFQSSLQSFTGRYLTVLDCIYNEKLQEFFVLDVLVYHNQEFLLCDTTLRFFWVKSKFEEFDYSAVHDGNQYPFNYIERYDLEQPNQVHEALNRYPIWSENKPELDGFLFYHKDANYTHGKTPLVGWLYPYMISEILGFSVNPNYLKVKPETYNNALSYMNQFEQNRRSARKKKQFFNKKGKSVDEAKCPDMELDEVKEADNELDDIDLEVDADHFDDQKHISIFTF